MKKLTSTILASCLLLFSACSKTATSCCVAIRNASTEDMVVVGPSETILATILKNTDMEIYLEYGKSYNLKRGNYTARISVPNERCKHKWNSGLKLDYKIDDDYATIKASVKVKNAGSIEDNWAADTATHDQKVMSVNGEPKGADGMAYQIDDSLIIIQKTDNEPINCVNLRGPTISIPRGESMWVSSCSLTIPSKDFWKAMSNK